MANYSVPTSRDIYIEVNGKKLAVVESYKVSATRESRPVEAFGQADPVATIAGRIKYNLELSRVYVNPANTDGIDFYGLTDFNVVIVKPGSKIIYSGCEWASIQEGVGINDTVLEDVKIIASKRMTGK